MAIIEVLREGAVATVLLNRPERMNALTVEMREGIADAFGNLGLDDDIRAIVLTAAGPAFCASGDVGKMGNFTPASAKKLLKIAHRMVLSVANVEKPVVAAVRGAVAGIGWSLALASDVVVASRTAKFSQVFKKVGVVPDGGAIYFLTQSLGILRAKDLVYSARTVSAEEAFEVGLVTKLVDDDTLEDEARKIAEELASGPTFAFGNAKKLFKTMYQPTLEAFLDAELWAQSLTVLSEDHKEGAAAFLQKRRAQFSGR